MFIRVSLISKMKRWLKLNGKELSSMKVNLRIVKLKSITMRH